MELIYAGGGLVGLFLSYFIYKNYKKTAFWTVIALIFPWFTYTGTYFNLSHSPPFVYYRPKQPALIFWPSQQMQTVSEGLIMASLIVLIGVLFSLFFTLIPNIRYSRRRLCFYPLFVIISGLLYTYYNIWKIKSAWYLQYN